MTSPVVLTIGGSDPSGGAGIQADLKTFTALNCYGTSVTTVLTTQNTTGVRGIHPCPPEFVSAQLESVLDDIDVLVMKTGMLYNEATIQAVASTLKKYCGEKPLQLVCDPVCVSTYGDALLLDSAVESLIDEVLPLATLITPNESEAELILSHKREKVTISSLTGLVSASKELLTLGPKAVLIKGGSVTTTITEIRELLGANPEISLYKYGLLDENMNILQVGLGERDLSPRLVVNVLQESRGPGGEAETSVFIQPWIRSMNTHGAGCTLSAAIVCGLARGLTIPEAVRDGTIYTHLLILHAFPVGAGYSLLNHTHLVVSRSVPRPCPGDRHPLTRLLISSTATVWKEFVEHAFVKGLGKGSLDKRCFVHFIKQDYHFLKYYARAYALLAAKSTNFRAITAATQSVQNILGEVSTNHMTFCAKWGISEKELEGTPESTATTAYGAYIIDIGFQGDGAKLNMALAACLIGYGEVGLWLVDESKRPGSWVIMDESSNPYVPWINEYSGEMYQKAVETGLATIEGIGSMVPITDERFEELAKIWRKCVVLEKGFWDMAITLS